MAIIPQNKQNPSNPTISKNIDPKMEGVPVQPSLPRVNQIRWWLTNFRWFNPLFRGLNHHDSQVWPGSAHTEIWSSRLRMRGRRGDEEKRRRGEDAGKRVIKSRDPFLAGGEIVAEDSTALALCAWAVRLVQSATWWRRSLLNTWNSREYASSGEQHINY